MRYVQPGWQRVALLAVALVAVTLVMLAFRERLDKAHVALVYLLIVLAGSAAEGRRVGLALAGTAFLAFNYVFLPPYYTLIIADPLDWIVLLAFLATGVVAAELMERLRLQAEVARLRTAELDRLSTLGAETLNAARADQALAAIAGVLASAVGVEQCALFVREGETLRVTQHEPAEHQFTPIDPASLVGYVVQSGQAAIEQDDGTLRILGLALEKGHAKAIRNVRALAVPLTARGQTVGALRLTSSSRFSVSAEQRRVLTVLAYYAALGIERLRLERAEETADALRRTDRLKDALLASVSHDLRTPLTTIKAIAHEIGSGGAPTRAAIIEEEVDRLSSLVDGLLQLSQLDAGALPMDIAFNTVDDLIGAGLQRASGLLAAHPVDVEMPEAILAGRFDFSQTLRILVNLLENAAKYSPPGAPITVTARATGSDLAIEVSDRGPGVPAEEIEKVFMPFYRAPGATPDVRGAGLGLTIARRLAREQGGDLVLSPRAGGGSAFTIRLVGA